MLQFKNQDAAGEQQGDGIGHNDGQFAQKDAVHQPAKDANGEDNVHTEADPFGIFGFEDMHHLWHKGNGGTGGSGQSDEGGKIHNRALSKDTKYGTGSYEKFLRFPEKLFVIKSG